MKKLSIRKGYHQPLVVLVVEDQLIFSKVVQQALPDDDIVIAKTLDAAYDLYENHHPDLIFLDIELPDGTGHEFLHALRRFDQEAYVVMMTGSHLEMDRYIAQDYGVQGYMIKPCTLDKIQHYAKICSEERQERMRQLISGTNAARERKKP